MLRRIDEKLRKIKGKVELVSFTLAQRETSKDMTLL
jgi:hypothetical protein